ncbi:MAG: leucine-rich repeat protein [Ruminococcus sp.]|uniref:leucine-rich repeat protein n=1 Tax=Ruminococcus sp. TaxID=41978 RepID=UPI0025DD1F44|nr:leucine-rich repeat protein [Ruminococcus sp.]MCR4794576.1 leucine-rich repeat protein [Ruminococcus sp.]
MKIQFKKAVSFILSAVMTVSTLTSIVSSAEVGYETDESTVAAEQQQTAGNGMFGSLNYNAPNVASDEPNEAENPDFIIYKVEHDRYMSSVVVNYHAKEDCTLFVGIYNDEGTQLYSSVTSELSADGDGYAELTILDVLPEHYLVKAFLVGKMLQEPLSKPAYYNKETQAMQNILSANTEDFEEDNVVNLDGDKNNNFFVLQDEVKEIKAPDINVEQGEDGRFTFKKCDEISALKKGDKAVVYAENDIVAFVVEKAEVSGDNIIITPVADADVSEIFKFIKIDTTEVEEIEQKSAPESNDQAEPKKAPDAFEPVYLDSPTCLDGTKTFTKRMEIEYKFIGHEFDIPNEKVDAEVGFYAKLIIKTEIEFYYSVWDLYYSYTGSADASVIIEGEGEVDYDIKAINPRTHSAFSDADFPVVGNKIVGIYIQPKVFLFAKGDIDVSYTREYVLSGAKNEEKKFTPKEPCIDNMNISAELGIRVEVEIKLVLLSYKILTVTPYAELKAVVETSGINLKPDYVEPNYIKHKCSACVAMDIYLDIGVSIGIKENKWQYTPLELGWKLGSFHWSSKTGFGKGECPNKYHKIKIKVVSYKTGKPLEAMVYNLNDNENDFELTDSKGELEVFVKDEKLNDDTYCIRAKDFDGDEGICFVGGQWSETADHVQSFRLAIYKEKEETENKDKEKESDEESDLDEPDDDWVASGRLPYGIDDEESEEYTGPYTYYYVNKEGECYFWGDGALQLPNFSKYGAKKAIVVDPKMNLGKIKYSGETVVDSYSDPGSWESIDLSVMNITRIPDGAFDNMTNLKEIILPETVKEIGNRAFQNDINLKNIVIPDGVTSISRNAFAGSGLTSFTCPKNLEMIEGWVFDDCFELKEINFNNGLKHIGAGAFQCSGIQSVNIPSSVTEIGEAAFAECKNLKTIILNNDFKIVKADYVTSDYKPEVLADSERLGCIFSSGVKKVIINEGVTGIYPYLFEITSVIEELKLPDSLTYIGDHAFFSTHIKDLKIPKNVSYIGNYAFNSCLIENLELPASVSYLGEGAFGAAHNLKSITINNSKCAYSEKRPPIPKFYSGSEDRNEPIIVYGHEVPDTEKYSAEKLAELTGNTFVSLDKPEETPSVTTTVSNTSTTTTTTTTTTTVTTVVTTVVAADTECVFIAIRDAATAVAESYELLDVNNVAYFDQQTADSDGKVSFSYIPDEKEEWTFIFVGEAVNDVVTRTVGTLDGLKKTRYYEDEPIVSGDANGDGEVDMSDIVLIMQALANPNKYGVDGTEPSHLTNKGSVFADADENGLTVNDALRIQLYLLNKISSLD